MNAQAREIQDVASEPSPAHGRAPTALAVKLASEKNRMIVQGHIAGGRIPYRECETWTVNGRYWAKVDWPGVNGRRGLTMVFAFDAFASDAGGPRRQFGLRGVAP